MIRIPRFVAAVARAAVPLVALAAPLAEAAPAEPSADASTRRPNVILVVADDLGRHEVGAHGQARLRTPHVDRLAAEGLRFDDFRSGAPVCAPSRAVLLTGRHTGHVPIRGNAENGGWGPDAPEGQRALPAAITTTAERLRKAGYATWIAGKWGLGGPGSEGHPCAQGFDRFYGYLCQRVAHNHHPTHLWRNHDVDVLDGNRWFAAHQRLDAVPDDADWKARYRGPVHAPTRIRDEMLGWLREHGERTPEQPFFLVYASIIPHVALQAPEAWIDRFPRAWDDEAYLGTRGYLPTSRPRATYAAMIAFWDDVVGRLRAEVEAAGLAEDTVILVTSDNGTTYAGGVDHAFFDSFAGLRGTKGTLFEGGLAVPLVAWGPGRIPAGRATDAPAWFCDLHPTVCDLAGVDAGTGDEAPDGASLVALLEGRDDDRPASVQYWEHPEGPGWQAVVDGRWKLVRRNLQRGEPVTMLFDLERDPGERDDVAGAHPEVVSRLLARARAERTPSATFPIRTLDAESRAAPRTRP